MTVEETTTTMADPRLPRGVVCLEQVLERVNDPTLEETIELSMKNGYWLTGIDERDDIYGTEYTLLKREVDDD